MVFSFYENFNKIFCKCKFNVWFDHLKEFETFLCLLYRCQHWNHTACEQHVVFAVNVPFIHDNEHNKLQRSPKLPSGRSRGWAWSRTRYHGTQLGCTQPIPTQSTIRSCPNHFYTVHANVTHAWQLAAVNRVTDWSESEQQLYGESVLK